MPGVFCKDSTVFTSFSSSVSIVSLCHELSDSSVCIPRFFISSF